MISASHVSPLNMLSRSHLGLVHRLEDPIKSCLMGVDSGSSDVDNGLSTVLIELGVACMLQTESPSWQEMHLGQAVSYLAS